MVATGCGDSTDETRDAVTSPETVADIESETVADIESETVADIVADTGPETVTDIESETVADIEPETVADIEPETVACTCVGSEVCVNGACTCPTLTLVKTEPTRNAISAQPHAPLALTFSCRVSLPTTIALPVVSSQRGRAAGTWSHGPSEDVTVFTPTRGFLAGERVDVTITDGAVVSVVPEHVNARPHAFAFTIATAPASGLFVAHPSTLPGFRDSATLGDLDGDGDLDILSSGGVGLTTPLSVWLGATDASGFALTPTEQTSAPDYSYGAALGDIDGDGDNDALALRHTIHPPQPAQRILRNDGSGAFTVETDGLPAMAGYAVAIMDIERDGDLDFIAATYQQIQVLVNDGSGHFTSGATVATEFTFHLAVGDFDDDGINDFAFTSFMSSLDLYIAYGDGLGGFTRSPSLQHSASINSQEIGIGDVDGDGDLDLVLPTLTHGDEPLLLRNDGQRTFTPIAGAFDGTSTLLLRPEISLLDLDGDGDLDAYGRAANVSPQDDELWVNDGTGHFTLRDDPSTSYTVYDAYPGDLDGDGDLDLFEVSTTAGRFLMNQPAALPR